MSTLQVKASSNIQDLQGEGLEYLLDQNGNVIAKFWDGNFIRAVEILGNTEPTLLVA